MKPDLTTDKALATLDAIHGLCVQKLKAELADLPLEEHTIKITVGGLSMTPQEIVALVEQRKDGCWDYVLSMVVMGFEAETTLARMGVYHD